MPLVMRGEDFFRGAVIDALGDYGGRYALGPITDRRRDSRGRCRTMPSRRLGELGDPSSRALLATSAGDGARGNPADRLSAALCLLGIDCPARLDVSDRDTCSSRPTTQATSRCCVAPSTRLAVLASRGTDAPGRRLLDVGVPATGRRAGAHRPGRRPGGAAQSGASSMVSGGLEHGRPGGPRAAPRRVRHAVRGLRGRAVLRRPCAGAAGTAPGGSRGARWRTRC